MNIVMGAIVVVVVVGGAIYDITYGIHSPEFRNNVAFQKGRNDYKKGCMSKYQRYYLEQRQKGDISAYKSSYIDGYNCEMHQI